MIEGVVTKLLKVNCDERGRLFEALRSDDELFIHFGQAYITTSYPGVVKAWHLHQNQTDHMCVVSGRAKFVLYDGREQSPTFGEINEFFPCDDRRMLLQIPPGIYHGFKNIGSEELIILNIPTHTFCYDNPDEIRLAPHGNQIPYDWSRQDG
jgi:dTDP-4-dehydrorhamnose 3,5-epimerase